MNLSLEEAVEFIHPINDHYVIVIYYGSGISFFLCALLSYVVYRHTPISMHSRKVSLLNLLAGSFILTLFYLLSQSMPILPFRIVLLSGPLRSFGSTVAAIFYGLWFSVMTFTGNGCMISSLSHYLDLTTGLSSQNMLFRYLRRISLRKRMMLFHCYHLGHFVASMLTITLIYVDFVFTPELETLKELLEDEHAMIQLETEPYTTMLVTLSFAALLASYAVGITYLNYSIKKQMIALRSAISAKTFVLLSSMSQIFYSLILAPIFFFFLPHILFIVCNFHWPQMVSTPEWLVFITVTITVLYGLFPFSIYLFLVIGFKQYRTECFHLLTFHRFSRKNSPTSSRFS